MERDKVLSFAMRILLDAYEKDKRRKYLEAYNTLHGIKYGTDNIHPVMTDALKTILPKEGER